MSKVITFSRFFPAYHPRAGQPTYFEERICRSIWDNKLIVDIDEVFFPEIMKRFTVNVAAGYPPKHHTIRAGKRFKQGDMFSPRVWSGKPYNSKQIQFAPNMEVKKVWDFGIAKVNDGMLSSYEMFVNEKLTRKGADIIKNDGLEYNDFCDWFKMDSAKKVIAFEGQIICWNESIEY